MNFDINWSKEQLLNFLKGNGQNIKLGDVFFSNIIKEEIDGEVFSLLSKKYLKDLGIKGKSLNEVSNLIKKKEKNILSLKEDLEKDKIYIQVNEEDPNDIWNSLDEKLKSLKIGEKLKFIKYLLIRFPPPTMEPQEQFINYMKKVFTKNGDSDPFQEINNNIDDFKDDLLSIEVDDVLKEKQDAFKLKIIIELLKKQINEVDKDVSKLPKDNEEIENKEEIIFHDELNKDNNYKIYSVIEQYKYKTSQNQHTYGLLNPIKEFERLADDFHIRKINEKSWISFKKAFQIKLTSFTLWGSKEGLIKFWKENNIENAITYFEKNDKETGIYLCIENSKKIAYLIIWPGEYSFQYTNIDEPNNNILLTLVRYGFSLSNISILSLSDNEINNFDFNSYKIFEKKLEMGCKRGKIEFDENIEKKFEIKNGNGKLLQEKLNNKKNNKYIIESKIRQNNILLYETEGIFESKKYNCFISSYSNHHFFFDEKFDCSPETFINFFKNNEDICMDIREIFNDIIIDEIISPLKHFYDDLVNNDKSEEIFLCEYCKKKSSIIEEIYFNIINDEVKYIHKNCSELNNNNYQYKDIKEGNSKEKIKLFKYLKYKKEILKSLEPENPLNIHFMNIFEIIESRFEKTSFCHPKEKESFISKIYVHLTYIIPSFKEREPPKIYLINEKIIQEEIVKLKNIFKVSPQIINEIIDYFILLNRKEGNKILEKIKLDIISQINNYYNNNKFSVKEWLMIKSIEEENINFYKFNFQNHSISLYEIRPLKSSNDLSLLFEKNILVPKADNQIIDYFIRNQAEEIIIYKNYKTDELLISPKNIHIKIGLYDYDTKSDSLLIYKIEEIKNEFRKSLGFYLGNNPCKIIDTKFLGDNKLKKMILIPCDKNYANQSALFIIEKKQNKNIIINVKNIINNIIEPTNLELCKEFNDYFDFNEFQFIVHINFLLILKFNNKEKKWNGKIYSLNLEDDSLFNKITEIELEEDKKSKFSFIEVNEKNYFLLSFNINQEQLIIKYWEIYLNLSKIIIKISSENDNNNNKLKDLSLGNCVVNYFYHCFEKYHLISSIEFNININNNNSTKLNIFLGKKNKIHFEKFQKYIKILNKKSSENKKIDFDEIKFEFLKDHTTMYNKNNSSLGDVILKILETTPIQIAKIINNEFEIMSDWKQLNSLINRSPEMDEIKEMIKLGMKENILY